MQHHTSTSVEPIRGYIMGVNCALWEASDLLCGISAMGPPRLLLGLMLTSLTAERAVLHDLRGKDAAACADDLRRWHVRP